jgi:hypothetical protein
VVEARNQAQGLKEKEFRFGRKDVREATGWGDTQLKIHLVKRLRQSLGRQPQVLKK